MVLFSPVPRVSPGFTKRPYSYTVSIPMYYIHPYTVHILSIYMYLHTTHISYILYIYYIYPICYILYTLYMYLYTIYLSYVLYTVCIISTCVYLLCIRSEDGRNDPNNVCTNPHGRPPDEGMVCNCRTDLRFRLVFSTGTTQGHRSVRTLVEGSGLGYVREKRNSSNSTQK